jgi:hypothetical protein
MTDAKDINFDPRFARKLAKLLRESVIKHEPGDLYFECENAERIATAELYERAADEIEQGTRKYLPAAEEFRSIHDAAWKKIKDR